MRVNFDASIKIFPNFIEATQENLKEEFKYKTKNFIETMSDNCKNTNLDYFYKNFSTASFALDNKKDSSCGGDYDTFYNKIDINNFSSVYHELMHMASSRSNGSYIHSGFSVSNPSNRIKVASMFNEGYTQLLAERYFDSKTKSYSFEVNVVKQIENIIGKDLMEGLYFKGDFNGLVNELNKYESEDSVKQFFKDLETRINCFNPATLDLEKAGKCVGRINAFIENCSSNKYSSSDDIKKCI